MLKYRQFQDAVPSSASIGYIICLKVVEIAIENHYHFISGKDSLTSLQISANQDKKKTIDSLLTEPENKKADVEDCTVDKETIDNFDEPTVNTSKGYHGRLH